MFGNSFGYQNNFNLEINNNIYSEVYNLSNSILAYKKARKGKTKRGYVIEFEKDLINILLHFLISY